MKNNLDGYDRTAAGCRIRSLRKMLGFTREEMAGAVGRSAKYYADIERGSCGMSVETLLAIAGYLGTSLDYILLGSEKTDECSPVERHAICLLQRMPEEKQSYMLKTMMLLSEAYEKNE